MIKALQFFNTEVDRLLNDGIILNEEIKEDKKLLKNYKFKEKKYGEDHSAKILELENNILRKEMDLSELKMIRRHYQTAIESFKLYAVIKKNIKDPELPNWYIFFTNDKVMKQFTKTQKEIIYGKECE